MFEALLDSAASEGYTSSLNPGPSPSPSPSPIALTLALTLQATRCWRSRRWAICWEAERERGGGKGRGLKSY